MYSMLKLHRLLLSTLLPGLLFFGGCVAEKQMIPPYQGRVEREVAVQEQGVEPSVSRTTTVVDVSKQPLETEGDIFSDADLLLPILTHVNERIYSYEQRRNAWMALNAKIASLNLTEQKLEKIARCGQQLEDILEQYNSFHQRLLLEESVTTRQLLQGEAFLALDKLDLQFLESDCNAITTAGQALPLALSTDVDVVRQQKKEIDEAFAAGNYEQTIAGYEHLQATSGVEPSFDLTYAYGRSLMKSGRENEARSVFKELLARIRQQDQAQWEFTLMQLIGDLDFAFEDYQPAQEQYDEIIKIYEGLSDRNNWAKQQLSALHVADEQSEEVKAYANLLRSYLAYNPDRDGFSVADKAEHFVNSYPYSLVASSADHLVVTSRKDAEQWYQKIVQQVDKLAAEGKYQEAMLVIERIPRTILPVEKQRQLLDKSQELATTEAMTRESTRLAEEQQAQESWNKGMAYLQSREYDQAIESFRKLLGGTSDERARKKIDEAAGLAAQEDRRRAAELFVRSNRTSDMESRKRLLLASRQLLQDILIKYPQSDLIDKVRRNLKRIEEAINNIDPTLLTSPLTINGSLPEPIDASNPGLIDGEKQVEDVPSSSVQP